MIAIGIAFGILGYALMYSGVYGVTGKVVGVLESLRPGFDPAKIGAADPLEGYTSPRNYPWNVDYTSQHLKEVREEDKGIGYRQ